MSAGDDTAAAPGLRRRGLFALLTAAGAAMGLGGAQASPLKRDEHVLALPGLLWQGADGQLQADIELWVYENERRPGARSLFARYLGIELSQLSARERALFETRARWFLKDSERGKRLSIEMNGQGPLPLNRTDRAGRSSTQIGLPSALWNRAWERAPAQPQAYSVTGRSQSQGWLWPVAAQGLSIVSDIDDTIKISQVRDTRQLLRESTSWSRLIPGAQDGQRHKLAHLQRLMVRFPGRRFVLIGDSGEADPEIYAQAASRHPQQVAAILIRDVTGEAASAARYRQAMAALPAATPWYLIEDGAQGLAIAQQHGFWL
ncbi:App1 family protein [Vandammella animalimorsus]|uniref:App1 family protein n=1 Tax=Vandammella animalimorsus TaxID=2029117 RepID=UPI0031BA285D